MRVLGIDEAGRGPAIGPLVICGVWADKDALRAFDALGVRDSKAYTGSKAAAARAKAAAQIRKVAHVEVISLSPLEIDRWVAEGGLNRLEQQAAQAIIERQPLPQSIIADGAKVFSPLSESYPQLQAIDKADADHPVVAAASIVAKDVRDAALDTLLAPYQARFGPIRGGGYPNGGTAAFLEAVVESDGRLPDGIRHSWQWKTLIALKARLGERGCG